MIEFSKEEIRLFDMIVESLIGIGTNKEQDADLHKLIMLSNHHSILPIIYPALKDVELSDEDSELLKRSVNNEASNFYRLIFAARDITRDLSAGGVPVVLLKGASVARYYPIPESRRSTDVDILLANPKDMERAEEILSASGFRRKKESAEDYEANHHQVWISGNGTVAEVHTMVTEPFAEKELNEYIDKRFLLEDSDIETASILNFKLPVLKDDRQAFHLFVHMLMDFYRKGFGLKLLCDWVVFWNRKVDPEMTGAFLKDVEGCHQKGFLSVMTSSCIRYLGLKTDGSGTLSVSGDMIVCEAGEFCELASDDLCRDFLMDVLDTERYGKPSDDRMVVMEDTGLIGLIKEFHHQTALNFPRAHKTIILLPVLYVITLVRYLKNNKKIRGGQSTLDVIKKANERGALLKKIRSLS